MVLWLAYLFPQPMANKEQFLLSFLKPVIVLPVPFGQAKITHFIFTHNDRAMKILGLDAICSCQRDTGKKNTEREKTMRKVSRFGYDTIEIPYGAPESQIAFLTVRFI